MKVFSGFKIENLGYVTSLVKPRFKVSSVLVITDEFELSEPAAAMVNTVPTGILFVGASL